MGRLTQEGFSRFINPRSVAIIGASERTGPDSFNVLENMLESGCRCRIYPVNLRAREILGQKVFRSVLDIPEVVDLAVISTPRTAVLEIVRECVQKGVKAVIVITQGFADADAEGHRLQEELQKIIAGTGTRLLGPNTIGVLNNFDNFHTSFVKFDPFRKENGVICQSGIFVLGAPYFTEGLGIGVDIGNVGDVNFTDVLLCFARDPRIKVINIHMEGIKEGREFLEAAAQVTREKPVLVLKTGKSEAGARAAASHTGSLAGEDHVFTAAFQKAGIIRVADFEELKDLNKVLLTFPQMNGKRVAVLTISGGSGIAAVDALSEYGLEVARLSPDVLEKIQAMSPPWLEVGNPVDMWPAGMKRGLRKTYVEILRLLLDDHQVDAVICVMAAYKLTGEDVMSAVLDDVVKEAARKREKPVTVWVFGANQKKVIAELDQSGVVAGFPNPERIARALAGLYRYQHEIKARTPEKLAVFPDVEREKVAGILRKAQKDGVSLLGTEALEILQAYGIAAAVARLASTQEEALTIAAGLGYPVVMKVASPQIIHKSDAGGVRLGIQNEAELSRAYDEMLVTVKERVPQAQIAGVFLQKYHPGGVEVILGAKRDAEFGPVVVFGLGGIYTEVLRDVSFRLAPLSQREAAEMINEIKSSRILRGARGTPAVNIAALVDSLMRLGQLVVDFPEIAELDVNPLAAGPEGVLALDARILLEFKA